MFSTETSKSISGNQRDIPRRSQTFFATRRKVSGRKRETIQVSGLLGNQDHQTQNKKEKDYEKSKHSVQSNSATLQKHGTSPRVPHGGIYLCAQSSVSSQIGRAH